jgi:hypothetical protein
MRENTAPPFHRCAGRERKPLHDAVSSARGLRAPSHASLTAACSPVKGNAHAGKRPCGGTATSISNGHGRLLLWPPPAVGDAASYGTGREERSEREANELGFQGRSSRLRVLFRRDARVTIGLRSTDEKDRARFSLGGRRKFRPMPRLQPRRGRGRHCWTLGCSSAGPK